VNLKRNLVPDNNRSSPFAGKVAPLHHGTSSPGGNRLLHLQFFQKFISLDSCCPEDVGKSVLPLRCDTHPSDNPPAMNQICSTPNLHWKEYLSTFSKTAKHSGNSYSRAGFGQGLIDIHQKAIFCSNEHRERINLVRRDKLSLRNLQWRQSDGSHNPGEASASATARTAFSLTAFSVRLSVAAKPQAPFFRTRIRPVIGASFIGSTVRRYRQALRFLPLPTDGIPRRFPALVQYQLTNLVRSIYPSCQTQKI